MSVTMFFHHTEIGSTDCYHDDHGKAVIHADIKNRDGARAVMFFDCVDDLESMADELRFLAEGIREREPKDFCATTGEVLV